MGMGVVPDPFVGREVTSAKGDDAYLYILLIMIFYACLAGGLILAYTRSRRLVKAKDEPSQACAGACEQEWAAGSSRVNDDDAETAARPPAQGLPQPVPGALPAPALGAKPV
jgi:potassium voltage-gated channel Isk-related subfamily E protein 1